MSARLKRKNMECSGWMDGWMDGWMGGWVDGWMGGSKSRVKDCLQQSKKEYLQILKLFAMCLCMFAEYVNFQHTLS